MGVWRTVGGRRIYIEDGEDLETAMRKSGKFENKKQEQHKANEFEEDIKSYDKEIAKRKAEIEKVNNREGIYSTMPENAREIVKTNAARSIAEYEIYKEYARNGYQENGKEISVEEMMKKAKERAAKKIK